MGGAKRLLDLCPAEAASFRVHAAALVGLDDFAGATEATRQAIALDPTDASMWSAYGALLLAPHQKSQAKSACLRALQLNSEDEECWQRLMALGDIAEATTEPAGGGLSATA